MPRLGYGLCAAGNRRDTCRSHKLAPDVFYIATRGSITVPGFFYPKAAGAVLAKGRLLGMRFDTLFTESTS